MLALDIHIATAVPMRRGSIPSAFILSRTIWGATVRGFWPLECAREEQIQKFIAHASGRKTWQMIEEWEARKSFDFKTLSGICSNNSRRLIDDPCRKPFLH